MNQGSTVKPRWGSSPTKSFAAIIKTTVDEIPDLEPNCTRDPHKLGGSIARVVADRVPNQQLPDSRAARADAARPLCGSGSGTLAESGDATWSHAKTPTDAWTQAGGDFNATPSAGIAMPFSGVATWTSTAGLVADVQSWLDAPSGNFGWIVLGNEVAARSARQFQSRESVSGPHPALRLEYTAPTSGPPAVPDGSPGSPVRLSKLSPNGADIGITWDGALCSGTFGHHVVHGTSAGFPAVPAGPYTLQGSVCSLGTAPPGTWTGSPDPAALDPAKKLIWILVLADDGTTEGSWGWNSASQERNGTGTNGSSSQCGMLDKSVANACGN